jgi:N-acetylmuramoyl-L-alanine amidase
MLHHKIPPTSEIFSARNRIALKLKNRSMFPIPFPCSIGSLLVLFIAASAVPAHAQSPARNKPSPPAGPFQTVVIDAGHGGHDLGGIRGQKVQEKVVALDVAKRLQKELKSAGFSTVMTRTSDVFVSLGQRVAIANAHPDAIFVSVHFNAARRAGARGVETFYATRNSQPIAVHIQRALVSIPRTESRGVKHAEFFVLRKNGIRAALTECGFLTNPEDTALAVKASYRQRLAEGMATAIQSYRMSL